MRVITALPILLTASSLFTSNFSPSTFQDRPTFRAESELVVLHVSVRDRGGRYLAGLGRDAFTVIDDGRPQTIEMFSGEDVPASIGVLIDNSNSMRPARERVAASAVALARHSHPQDEIFVLTFNEQVRRAWGPAIAGDMDLDRFGAAMSAAIGARGMTAIHDGVLAGLRRLEGAAHTRQVLIVISDGADNASRATQADVLKQVRESDATIYAVVLTDPLTRDGNPGFLRRLARSTGGEAHRPERMEDVPRAFDRIARDIRSAYTLAYAPARAAGEPAAGRKRRAVRVYARSSDGRALSVRTREGYFEKAPAAAQR